ncbi:hypothetical protein [Microseira wollei]|uniref:hypothetical protein n=1 Tax=Microseira wollei TaxID=467598 RepID=UPI001CFEC212|nr:hypothetical protein [Microseira wollei]
MPCPYNDGAACVGSVCGRDTALHTLLNHGRSLYCRVPTTMGRLVLVQFAVGTRHYIGC